MSIPLGMGPLVQDVIDSTAAIYAGAPGDQVRAMIHMAGLAGAGPLAVRARRAAVVGLARACALYQPSSRDDALQLLASVVTIMDAAITEAGDLGDDDAFDAFSALETAVVADLTARGGSLAPLITASFPTTLPDLVVAQRLYGDATRANELLDRVDPIHPLFMPPTMQVLGS